MCKVQRPRNQDTGTRGHTECAPRGLQIIKAYFCLKKCVEGVVVQWCNPLILQTEQSVMQTKLSTLEPHLKSVMSPPNIYACMSGFLD